MSRAKSGSLAYGTALGSISHLRFSKRLNQRKTDIGVAAANGSYEPILTNAARTTNWCETRKADIGGKKTDQTGNGPLPAVSALQPTNQPFDTIAMTAARTDAIC
ncbi:MAG: hypothetical protein HKP37_11185 [Boseongicola sp.]|nr:hypothetical protein [Boseongicola sp.]